MLALLMNTVLNNNQGHVVCLSQQNSDELFPCIYFTNYSYLPDCRPLDSLTPRTSMSSLWLVIYHLCGHVSCIPQQLSSRHNGEFHGYCVESLLSSINSTLIIINTFIIQVGSYYVITIFTLFGIEASYIPLLA